MNVFVLCTGRCGSVTFDKACQHIKNYTSAHESRSRMVGEARLDYPPNHIEADNRLSWVLGRLDKKYGDNAAYVHLRRDDREVAESYLKRAESPYAIVKAYCEGILMYGLKKPVTIDECLDFCDTVNTNIEVFLRDKTRVMDFRLETAREDFRKFWDFIGAEGDLETALACWDVKHNPSRPLSQPSAGILGALRRLKRRLTK